MKKIICIMLFLVSIFAFSIVVNAHQAVDVYINGELLETEQPAIVYQDRTMVPLRAICEKLNCNVEWDDYTNTALIENEITMVAAQIDNYTLTKKDRRLSGGDARTIAIDVPPLIINERTLIPARAISESLNAKVEWNGTSKRVDIIMEYDWIDDYSEDMAIVSKNGKKGYINKSGSEIIPLKYDLAYPFKEGLAQVSVHSGYTYNCGYINKAGNEVIPLKYSSASWWFQNGTAVVGKDNKKFVIDKNGNIVLDLSTMYDGVEPFSEGLAWVSKNYKCGYIDMSGKEVIPMIYDYVWGDTRDIRRNFENGIAPARISGKHGCIDADGNEIIPIIHEASGAVSENVVCMKLNGKWAYYDIWGNQITAYIFDEASEFDNGLATVYLNSEMITIDKETLYENQSIKP